MLRVFLLDDENSALTVLRHKLVKNFPEDVDVLGVSNDPEEALVYLSQDPKIDVLFLDVEMPGMSGIELLSQLPNRAFDVIFTTAFQQYAIDAIRKNAFDYLVKPIDETDLRAAVNRAFEKKAAQKNQIGKSDFQTLAQNILKAQSTVSKLSVPTNEGILLIPVSDIIRIEGSGSYTTIITATKQKVVASKNLSELEDMLAAHPIFFRVHKSHVVNLNHVIKYIRGEGGSAILSDGSEVEVARRRKEEFIARLG